MPSLYENLIRLYPSAHRRQFADEMIAVHREVRADAQQKGVAVTARFYLREISGLFRSALAEHARRIFGNRISFPISSRRFTMHSQFRFPKTTAVLMMIILAGVLLAIQKAKVINSSLLSVTPPAASIPPEHFNIVPVLAMAFAFFYAAGLIGWAILFALRRSGMHRLSEISDQPSLK
jgi:hypothetical protein